MLSALPAQPACWAQNSEASPKWEIGVLGGGGDEGDEGDRVELLQSAPDLQAGDARRLEIEVEQDQLGAEIFRELQRLGAVRGLPQDRHPLRFQGLPQIGSRQRLVINDQRGDHPFLCWAHSL